MECSEGLCDGLHLRPNVGAVTDPISRRPGLDDEPAGVDFPHPLGRTDKEIGEEFDRLFRDLVHEESTI